MDAYNWAAFIHILWLYDLTDFIYDSMLSGD